MLRNLVQLEHKIGDKIFHFACDNTSPINEVKNALFEFLKIVGNIEDQVKANQAAVNNETESATPPVVNPDPDIAKAE